MTICCIIECHSPYPPDYSQSFADRLISGDLSPLCMDNTKHQIIANKIDNIKISESKPRIRMSPNRKGKRDIKSYSNSVKHKYEPETVPDWFVMKNSNNSSLPSFVHGQPLETSLGFLDRHRLISPYVRIPSKKSSSSNTSTQFWWLSCMQFIASFTVTAIDTFKYFFHMALETWQQARMPNSSSQERNFE